MVLTPVPLQNVHVTCYYQSGLCRLCVLVLYGRCACLVQRLKSKNKLMEAIELLLWWTSWLTWLRDNHTSNYVFLIFLLCVKVHSRNLSLLHAVIIGNINHPLEGLEHKLPSNHFVATGVAESEVKYLTPSFPKFLTPNPAFPKFLTPDSDST